MATFKGTEYARLETDRLLLIGMTPAMNDTLFRHCSDEEIVDFLHLESMEDYEIDRQKYFAGLNTYRTSYCNFVLIDKRSGRFIGRCGLHTILLQHNRAEIGYAMNSDSDKRKGYMSEAVAAVIEYGFMQLGLNRIEAFVGPGNSASNRLMEKFGFTKEGLLREHFCWNGVTEDSYCYSLLKREYDELT